MEEPDIRAVGSCTLRVHGLLPERACKDAAGLQLAVAGALAEIAVQLRGEQPFEEGAVSAQAPP